MAKSLRDMEHSGAPVRTETGTVDGGAARDGNQGVSSSGDDIQGGRGDDCAADMRVEDVLSPTLGAEGLAVPTSPDFQDSVHEVLDLWDRVDFLSEVHEKPDS